jgi:ornithine cyclodeaminase/alanine dehydrogenase-like protein (mu-crystallin family)
MPSLLPERRGLGIKWLAYYPGNKAAGISAISALIVLNDPRTGALLAVMDGTLITAARTSATTGVSFELCARRGAEVAAVIGPGTEARAHLEVLPRVLPHLTRLWVAGRDAGQAERFCVEMAPAAPFALVPAADRAEAVRDADVVLTVTTATTERLLEFEWLKPGVTVVVLDNGGKETSILHAVDRVLVDDRRPFREPETLSRFPAGVPRLDAELGEVLLGRASGRENQSQRVLILNSGIASCDIVLAAAVYEQAKARGLGTPLEL